MIWLDTTNEFAVRFYKWSLAESYREVDENYPLLKLIDNEVSLRAREYFLSLGKEKQFELAAAFVKRFNPKALKILNHSLSRAEDMLLADYLAQIMASPSQSVLSSGQGDAKQISRSSLSRVLKQELGKVFGGPPQQVGDWEWFYIEKISTWEIGTWIDIGGRYHQLTYHQFIRVNPSLVLKETISALSWVGISSQTLWKGLTDSNSRKISKTLNTLCLKFTQNLPGLLDGLPLHEMEAASTGLKNLD